MLEPKPPKPLTTTQIVSVRAPTLALFFLIAFVTKSVEVHEGEERVTTLVFENQQLSQTRDALFEDREYRQYAPYAEEVVAVTGKVATDEIPVRVNTATPHAE